MQRKTLGRIVDARYVAMMNAMMHETLVSGTARRADLPGWPAAGKTGTSQDFRDAWFIGYTSHLVTGVWLGNDDNTPTRKQARRRAAGRNLEPLHEDRASGRRAFGAARLEQRLDECVAAAAAKCAGRARRHAGTATRGGP